LAFLCSNGLHFNAWHLISYSNFQCVMHKWVTITKFILKSDSFCNTLLRHFGAPICLKLAIKRIVLRWHQKLESCFPTFAFPLLVKQSVLHTPFDKDIRVHLCTLNVYCFRHKVNSVFLTWARVWGSRDIKRPPCCRSSPSEFIALLVVGGWLHLTI